MVQSLLTTMLLVVLFSGYLMVLYQLAASNKLHVKDNLLAEGHPLRAGLLAANLHGFSNLQVEGDSKLPFHFLHSCQARDSLAKPRHDHLSSTQAFHCDCLKFNKDQKKKRKKKTFKSDNFVHNTNVSNWEYVGPQFFP